MTIRNPIFPVIHSPALGPLTGRGGGGNGPSGDALLLEDGSYLLLEDGSFLLLE